MKTLHTYIKESFQNRAIEIESMPENDRVAAKILTMTHKWSKLGEEEEWNDGEKTHFDKLMSSIEQSNPKKYDTLIKLKSEIYSVKGTSEDARKEKIKVVTKFLNALFGFYKTEYNKNLKKGWGYDDPRYVFGAVIGCAEYMKNWFGENDANVKKYVGKLAATFEKITNQNINKYFEESKEKYVKAKTIYDDECKKVADFKAQYHEHKYVYFAECSECCVEIFFFDTAKFKNIDEAFKELQKVDDVTFRKYDLDQKIKYIVNTGKTVIMSLASSLYYFDDKECPENKAITTIGFLDELPTEVWRHSGYDHITRYSGKVYHKQNYIKVDSAAYYYNSLWTVNSEKK